MPCFYPIKAYRVVDKHGRDSGIVFNATSRDNITRELSLPCGSCIGCKMERSRQWAVRCMHEAKMYEKNCFITLTYNDEHLPDDRGLDYKDFQKFMKRLRKHFKGFQSITDGKGKKTFPIRFFMCGEYGENNLRPHFHACIFNFDFNDRIYLKTSASDSKIYTSETLNSLWSDKTDRPIGYATVGDVNFNTAAYVARYVIKKKLGRGYDSEYEFTDPETGEVHKRDKEFIRMSLRPGVGSGFYDKYRSDMFPHDICIVNGVEMKPPKYYYKKLAKDDGFMYDSIQYQRELRSRSLAADNTEQRLEVKEKVLDARLKFLKRELI